MDQGKAICLSEVLNIEKEAMIIEEVESDVHKGEKVTDLFIHSDAVGFNEHGNAAGGYLREQTRR